MEGGVVCLKPIHVCTYKEKLPEVIALLFLAHQNEGGGGELMLYPRGQRPYLVNVFVAGPACTLVHVYIYISNCYYLSYFHRTS